MGRLFWIALFFAGAASAHLAYVLYGPGFQAASLLEQARAVAGANSMKLLDAAERRQFFGTAANEAAIAICPLLIAAEPVALSAVFPDGFWMFAVYSGKGKPVYVLDEALAGQRSFVLTIARAAGLEDLLSTATADPVAAESWKTAIPGSEGLAVLWAAVPAPYLRPRVEATLARSRCGA